MNVLKYFEDFSQDAYLIGSLETLVSNCSQIVLISGIGILLSYWPLQFLLCCGSIMSLLMAN